MKNNRNIVERVAKAHFKLELLIIIKILMKIKYFAAALIEKLSI